jgi:hypothetical protein
MRVDTLHVPFRCQVNMICEFESDWLLQVRARTSGDTVERGGTRLKSGKSHSIVYNVWHTLHVR